MNHLRTFLHRMPMRTATTTRRLCTETATKPTDIKSLEHRVDALSRRVYTDISKQITDLRLSHSTLETNMNKHVLGLNMLVWACPIGCLLGWILTRVNMSYKQENRE